MTVVAPMRDTSCMRSHPLSRIPLVPLLERAPPNSLGDYLKAVAQLDVGLMYRFYLAYGHAFSPRALPSSFPVGTPRECYRNAGMLALEYPDLTYVEGLADNSILPVSHAWCVDSQGKVVDNTWTSTAQTTYFGVPVQTQVLEEHVSQTGYWGLFEGMSPAALISGAFDQLVHPDWMPKPKK